MKNQMGFDFAKRSAVQLSEAVEKNQEVLSSLRTSIVERVKRGEWVYVFGSGHSSLLPLELFHRAGGVYFVLPLVADYLMPQAGPSVVRVLERTAGVVTPLLDRMAPAPGEMVWIVSQSGINSACIDMALQAKARGLRTVAWTSRVHSQAVPSRHPSGKRLFEVCDEVVDLCGVVGDAAVPVPQGEGEGVGEVSAGPLSSLTSICLAHSLLTAAGTDLERDGVRCFYASVNTPTGEARNRDLEIKLRARAPWLS